MGGVMNLWEDPHGRSLVVSGCILNSVCCGGWDGMGGCSGLCVLVCMHG